MKIKKNKIRNVFFRHKAIEYLINTIECKYNFYKH